ncbi:Pyridine nucleotide-disulfide oxidoreductase, dimerization domain [Friedmanniomyces endolithicus]|nr:Pyridine nucleotide-disulfide oxidoreductase, dimerization domain [Friedmanniomyces endolithicus]KAK0301823.1 Pyridine nucleotide-disulfide oxidoreductase, dimerization domain [Friedmanniomyces endolithicus]KAK0822638.1 Pyridine nucleotide-disulfide oxidoreductase, dimerization domain [Friedmanniomyces endolithicus]
MDPEGRRNISDSTCGNAAGRYGRLVIIGGGSAAFAAALAAAPKAASVTIVNKGLPMGGCCVNVGCVPSKFLIQAAHVTSPHNNDPPFHGIHNVTERVSDFATLTAQNRALVEILRQEKYANVIADLENVKYIEGFGRLTRNVGQLAVEVRSNHEDQDPSEVLPADRVILASGVRTSLPSQLADGLAKVDYLTNETAYFEPKRPETLIVLGGGYIALEAAQMFARLGSKVTVLQRSEFVLSSLEREIGSELAQHFRGEGIEVEVDVDVTSVTPDGDKVVLKGTSRGEKRTFAASKLFLAAGRHANTEQISDLPIKLANTAHGGFVVSNNLQTSIPGVYAAGDCVADSPQYVYTAAAEGQLAALNALDTLYGQETRDMDYSAVPWVVFTSPAVAGVGLSCSQARAKGIDAEASTVPLHLLPRAIVRQDTRGFVTLIRNKTDDRIVGARVLAEEGGELTMEASLAVRYGIRAKDLAAMFHPYLTWNEAWKLAALGFNKDVKTLSCCAT